MRTVRQVMELQVALAERVKELLEEHGLGPVFAEHQKNIVVGLITDNGEAPEVLVDGLGDMTLLVLKVERD